MLWAKFTIDNLTCVRTNEKSLIVGGVVGTFKSLMCSTVTSIAHLTRIFEKKLEPEDMRRIALQITQCLAFLYSEKIGVGHSHLTPSNLFLELDSLDSLPQEKLLKVSGEPIGENVRLYTDKTFGKSQILSGVLFLHLHVLGVASSKLLLDNDSELVFIFDEPCL
jgi:hypothetical protein